MNRPDPYDSGSAHAGSDRISEAAVQTAHMHRPAPDSDPYNSKRMKRTQLKSLSRGELEAFVTSIGEKPFRAAQLWSWMYQKNIADFEHMTDLAKPLRARLKQLAAAARLDPMRITRSETTGTRKFLWRLEDGQSIESVYIPEGKRRTVCVSTQAGCAMGCAFCATGRMGLVRNLSVCEILEQVLSVWDCVGEKPTNIVVMGMGEPFQNYDAVIKAMTILNHPEGAAISARRITVSTCGIAPKIRQFADEGQPFKLAVSLNAATDAVRSRVMPVNRKYAIHELLDAAKYYSARMRKRITFEYVLIRGVNDSPEDASRLLDLLHGLPCKINLIACNVIAGGYERPSDDVIRRFAERLGPMCAPVTLRLSKGDDIGGACGQLATGCTHPKKP